MPLLPTRSPRRHRWPPDERDDQRTLAAARHARQCLALRHHPSTRSILVLSAGGPWGAYGAGLIAGWSGARAGPRPAFNLVTGVSTGALQATFAFLGPAYDSALLHAYTIDQERDLIDRRGLSGGALAGSFAGTRPLEARVRASLARVYGSVAREKAKGRLRLVGVVDALDGEMYAIDLTRIAAELTGREREDCYVGMLGHEVDAAGGQSGKFRGSYMISDPWMPCRFRDLLRTGIGGDNPGNALRQGHGQLSASGR